MGFIYKADTYCDACGEMVRRSLRDEGEVPKDAMDHNSYDSEEFPKDADIENEESDIPQYCSNCGDFFRNPLTSEGYKYVQSALNEIPAGTSIAKLVGFNHPHLAEWANWYNFRYFDAEDIEDAMNPDKYPSIGWYSDEAF